MAINGISGTYSQGNRNIITTEDDEAKASGRTKSKTSGSGSSLGMSDFLTLMAAQLANQDMMNPVSDTEYIAQMAQFASLEGMNTLQEYTLSSYAVSYTGKNVIISRISETTGKLETIYGKVDRVTFAGGSPKVVVDGVEYELHTVMEVSDKPIVPPSEDQLNVIGKYVKIVHVDEEAGSTMTLAGLVETLSYINEKFRVKIDGVFYDYDDIVEISDDPIEI